MALLTLLWVVSAGESWWSTAEAEHGQGDKCFGTAESERDAGDEPDLGVCRYLEPRAAMAMVTCWIVWVTCRRRCSSVRSGGICVSGSHCGGALLAEQN